MNRASPNNASRGAGLNPANRFESVLLERDPEYDDSDERPLLTEFIEDHSQSLITYNDSPDLGFRASVNPYRGCEHGCAYCYARPTHEYAGFSSGLDFESRIIVKSGAPELLRKELAAKRWEPQLVAISGVTDAYQPVERRLKLTRQCLEVLRDFRNPVGIVTKNDLVLRDVDILQPMAELDCAAVYVSLTTLDPDLRKRMEPRTSPANARLKAVRELNENGIPCGVLIAPVIPGLNDVEIPALIQAAAEAGARFTGYVMLRLPGSVKQVFEEWVEKNYPEKKERIFNRLKSVRNGRLSDSRFGARMKGEGVHAEQIASLFQVSCRKHGVQNKHPSLTTRHFRRLQPGGQLELF